jgi:hypothetical protein
MLKQQMTVSNWHKQTWFGNVAHLRGSYAAVYMHNMAALYGSPEAAILVCLQFSQAGNDVTDLVHTTHTAVLPTLWMLLNANINQLHVYTAGAARGGQQC